MQTNPVKVVQTNHFMPTLKYPWHLFAIKDQLYYYYKNLSGNFKKASFIAENATIEGSVIIAEGAKVFENACIKGNTYIGPNAIVGNNAVVRDSILEEDTQVGVGADIARSIFLKDSHFHGSGFIGDSIIGPGNRLAAGLITANKRFDRKTVKTMVKNKLIDTKLLSLGTITGEGVKTGIRVGTMPGVIISQYAQIPPGKIVKKNL
jgi:bifunctional UDP-N-acetylglucosamine pyrophosphorylase/glucosamine-1-phosphate N-acetyltransferase